MNDTLKEAMRLHKLGFAIIPLYPKSKRPKMSKWTSGDRLTWTEFLKVYKDGDNIGVRLGEASKIGKLYLACIDIDVKDEAFIEVAQKALEPIIGSFKVPTVISGSGKNSKHIYCLTHKPFKMITLLKEERGEVCIYSNGRQMVLPPSIHDTTGEKYRWLWPVLSSLDLCVFDFSSVEEGSLKKPQEKIVLQDFKPTQFDLALSNLSKEIVDIILYADVEDRSASLFKVAIAMIREGYTDNQIMSVLTDPNYDLAKASYEHAQTQSRNKAAFWILNYTIKKARDEADARHRFDVAVEVVEPLSDDQAVIQVSDLCAEIKWQDSLNKTQKGKLTATLNNVLLILENTIGPKIFKRDIFALNDMYGIDTPWGGKKHESITDEEILKLKVWFTKKYGIEPTDNMLGDAVSFIAVENSFHPVRDYLDSLEWDGVPRLDTWLKVYLKASMPEPYLSAVSRKTLCAMVARIYQPGIKFDHVLILNGPQGIGKSTAAQILASPPWFIDRLPDLRDKDSMLNLQGIWVAEMGELANMRLSSVETYKAFLTSQVDKFRLPYGQRRQDFKRQCIIIGSSNPQEFLNDPTGNRRFWPVLVKQCDFAALARDRNQLLAEAKFAWQDLGEDLYLSVIEEKQAIFIQEKHTTEDVDNYIEETWDEFDWSKTEFKKIPKEFKLDDLFSTFGIFGHLSFSKDAKRVAKLLRKKGYKKTVIHGGRKMWTCEGVTNVSQM